MAARKIFITDFDKTRLLELIKDARSVKGRQRDDLTLLVNELDRAEVVDSMKIPADVVTMNSRIKVVDVSSSEEMELTLVFPADADLEEKRISVLAPIGSAVFGYSKGDEVEWPVPAGLRRFRITEVSYQPEAAGDFDL